MHEGITGDDQTCVVGTRHVCCAATFYATMVLRHYGFTVYATMVFSLLCNTAGWLSRAERVCVRVNTVCMKMRQHTCACAWTSPGLGVPET